MSPRHSQYCLEQKKPFEEAERGFLEAHHRMPDRKLIAIVQVCFSCGRKFVPERGRKWCPRCRRLLISKTTVLRVP